MCPHSATLSNRINHPEPAFLFNLARKRSTHFVFHFCADRARSCIYSCIIFRKICFIKRSTQSFDNFRPEQKPLTLLGQASKRYIIILHICRALLGLTKRWAQLLQALLQANTPANSESPPLIGRTSVKWHLTMTTQLQHKHKDNDKDHSKDTKAYTCPPTGNPLLWLVEPSSNRRARDSPALAQSGSGSQRW